MAFPSTSPGLFPRGFFAQTSFMEVEEPMALEAARSYQAVELQVGLPWALVFSLASIAQKMDGVFVG